MADSAESIGKSTSNNGGVRINSAKTKANQVLIQNDNLLTIDLSPLMFLSY